MASVQSSRRSTGYGSRPRPAGGTSWELYSWLFMRVSGILLWVLVLGHVYIMHIAHEITEVDYQFVAQRWATPFWRAWDWAMLLLALVHGVNGVRVMLHDYVRDRGLRLASMLALYAVTFLFLIIGSLVILTFDAGV